MKLVQKSHEPFFMLSLKVMEFDYFVFVAILFMAN